ncbi:alkylphosphonate utilization protein [Burkholderia sp. MSMB0856]|uniref:alkylphosphonate utilization protein n=1 Tax=Burkholderia sp. MSMB0856 TaxID=1637869 RepID=UPI000755CD8C|nr:alkylphosphonate utilization protein [Burkholderia sp. MSMB0856]AOJ90795.1 alkylphosphonate utilization protein [Burkholderia sp. MSMB0856]KVH38208.1 alkylphosphonate utilization protein [Burkholderia sp. MSMB0856]
MKVAMNAAPDGSLTVRVECGHERPAGASTESIDESVERVVKDVNGTALSDGDSDVLIEDLCVKGSSIALKMGPEVKSIRLVGSNHNGDRKTDMGGVMLNAGFLKKA